jgi:two-component system, sensor histidine kinase FlrB
VTPEPSDSGELKEAFQLFSQTSSRLAEAYAELQGQVARLSAELAVANGELARRERLSALGEMAAKLAHQLRTPLAAALLYAGHLARPHIDDTERIRLAEKAVARLQHLERLVADMLAFVKGARGKPSRFPVAELLQDLGQIVEGQAVAQGLRFALHDETAGAALEVDRQAVAGALTSLLENAFQASQPGMEVRLEARVGGGPFVVFRVVDGGEGIADPAKAHLFDPFYTTRAEGSGLGLAIVKQAADAHGGWVEVDSRLGSGSVFSLYLPLAPGRP